MVKVPRLPHFLWEALGRRAAANYELHKRIFKTIVDDVAGYDLERRLPGLPADAPGLGRLWTRLVPPSALQTFKRLIQAARAILMEQIGHTPQMEAVGRCANDYMEFRQSVHASAS